ncbi:hypothetical protein D018_4482B, partial [Vibrio parahaemolyticus VP2007-007]
RLSGDVTSLLKAV